MRKPAAWVLIGALASGCASTVPPPRPVSAPPAAAMQAQDGSNRQTSVPWSRKWPLSWQDFKGPAPEGGVEGARTVYELTYEWQCRGTAFQFVVTAVFLPSRSWVKRSVVNDPVESDRVLGHEQTHFNLTEVYARRMRKYFKELYDPCGQSEDRLRGAVDRYITEEAATQKHYDDETRYGLTPARQRVWDRDVSEMLQGLESFATP